MTGLCGHRCWLLDSSLIYGRMRDMAEQETYNGWANRETCAFWLWVTNDEGWYNSVREFAAGNEYAQSYQDYLSDAPESYFLPDALGEDGYYASANEQLGRAVVEYVMETISELQDTPAWNAGGRELRLMRDDIGSVWRIDHAEIGAAARELVVES